MRILAVDYGTVRIGLALSDPMRVVAQPLPYVKAGSPKAAAAEIARICQERGVAEIVVGLPLRTDGAEGVSSAQARNFGERLATVTGLPVEYLDERFTSRTAERLLLEGDVSRKKRRELRDGVAALVLLQDLLYRRSLAAEANPGPGMPAPTPGSP